MNDFPTASTYLDPQTRRRTVLVCVMNNAADWQRVAATGWYRIPQRRAPRRIGADYLAFYQTGAFKDQPEAQTVTFYAPTRRYRLLTRREMLPDEADHPRADEYYFCIELGPLQRLAQPIPATSFRRVTFIHTTMERLFTAQDVRGLFYQEDPFDKLWNALREQGLRPLPNRLVAERPVDIALRARSGYLGIRCDDETDVRALRAPAPSAALPDRWDVLCLPASEIEQDLAACLRQIGAALINLGGSLR